MNDPTKRPRTETELRAAGEALAWYVASGRIGRQRPENQNAILGTIAAVEWMLGDGDPNPVAGMLRDVAEMRRIAGLPADRN